MMERKARENLSAAAVLCRGVGDGGEPHPNAATSRAYYAAYHACWTRMVEEGNDPPENERSGRYFRHDALPAEALRQEILTRDDADDLEYLRSLRIAADYMEDDLTAKACADAIDIAERLVAHLLGTDGGLAS